MSRRNIAREMAAGAPDYLGPDLNAVAYNQAYQAAFAGDPFVDLTHAQLSQPNVSASVSEAYMDATLNGHKSSTLVPVIREVPEPRSLGAVVSDGLVTGAKVTGLMFAGVVIGVGGATVNGNSSGYTSSTTDETQVILPVTPIEEVGSAPKKKSTGIVGITEQFANRWEEYCKPSGYPENDVEFPEEQIPDGVTQTKNGVYHVTNIVDEEIVLVDDRSTLVVDKGGYAPRIIACGDRMTVTIKGKADDVALIGEQPWLVVGHDGALVRGYADGIHSKADVNGDANTVMAAGKSARILVAGELDNSIIDNSFENTKFEADAEVVGDGKIRNRRHYDSDWY